MGTRMQNAQRAQLLGKLLKEWPRLRRFYQLGGMLVGAALGALVYWVTTA